jgi:hypothetical protein
VHAHKALLGYIEIGLGVASMLTPLGVIFTTTAFAAGMVLSAATTADSCASGQAGSCAFGVLSMTVGGAGFAAGRMAANLFDTARAAAGVTRRGLLKGAAFITRRVRDFSNGMSVIASGVSGLPCQDLQRAC